MTHTSAQRFGTLDVFRGLTVFLMIIVNTPGSGVLPFAPLRHADWHGCTLTDLVFPSFLFAAGAAMPFAQKKWETMPAAKVWFLILKRTVLLFVVGVLLTWYTSMYWGENGLAFVPLSNLRIMAVLQRIALCYLLAAMIIRQGSRREVLLIGMALLVLYWILLYVFGDPGRQYAISGNAVRKLDLLILGEAHMYRERGVVFDPEGLLSTLPATVNVLAGYCTTRFLIQKSMQGNVVVTLLLTGAALLLAALVWNGVFPFNKKLWTSSYVVLTTGIDLMVIAVLYYFLGVKRWNSGAYFFLVFGRNPLFLYVLSNLLLFFLILPVQKTNVYEWINTAIYQRLAPGALGSLLFALSFTLLCWFFGWIMDRNRVYVRL